MNNQQQQAAAYAQVYQQYQQAAMQYGQQVQQQQVAGQAVPAQAGVNPQKYKSTICNVWMMEGVCPRGRMCHYAHGVRELNYNYSYYWGQATGGAANAAAAGVMPRQEDYQSRFYKTAICQFWQQRGTCNNGDNCRWAHGENDLRRPEQNGSDDGTEQQQNDSGVVIGPQLPAAAEEANTGTDSNGADKNEAVEGGGGESTVEGADEAAGQEPAGTENGEGGGRKRTHQEAAQDGEEEAEGGESEKKKATA